MSKFTWGQVLDRFQYDFDGEVMDVVKFHPWKVNGCTVFKGQADTDRVHYHCEELHESSDNVLKLVISWMANKKLGNNEGSLVYGICRALCLDERKVNEH
jgi:hypothetical protein